ncbi:MAG: hypothetical protein MRJ68_20075, partial [Nitrospira sp.]|nr:hypothetical protein [Nitrospira sp.]
HYPDHYPCHQKQRLGHYSKKTMTELGARLAEQVGDILKERKPEPLEKGYKLWPERLDRAIQQVDYRREEALKR